jgi:hypothetical protein
VAKVLRDLTKSLVASSRGINLAAFGIKIFCAPIVTINSTCGTDSGKSMLLFIFDVEAAAPSMIVKKDKTCGPLCGTEDVVDRRIRGRFVPW